MSTQNKINNRNNDITFVIKEHNDVISKDSKRRWNVSNLFIMW